MAEQISETKKTYVYGLLVFSLIVAIVVALLVIRPLLDDNKEKQAVIDRKKTSLNLLKDKKDKLEELFSKYNEIKDKSKIIKMAIPNEKKEEGLYFQIESIVQSSGSTINSIDVKSKDALTTTTDERGQSSTGSENYSTLSFDLNITTTHQALKDILSNFNSALRILSVNKIDVQIKEGNTINVVLSVDAFINDSGEANE